MPDADRWIDAIALAELPVGVPTLTRPGGQRVVLVRTAEDELHAIEDACPHEGYPLSRGTVSGCVLTCPWHNFKFDLRSGACLKGDEAAQTFATRVVAGRVAVDLTPPDPAQARARRTASLLQAVLEDRGGQVARELVRLLHLGEPPAALAALLATDNGRRALDGPTHALPVATDALAVLDLFPGPKAALPLSLIAALTGEGHARRPPRARLAPVDPGPAGPAGAARLRALVEAEEAAEAEALVAGALARGLDGAALRDWLYPLATDHFVDFGHSLIYLTKLEELRALAGPEATAELTAAWVFGVTSGTREDLLPEWRPFTRRLEDLTPRLAALRARAVPGQAPDPGLLAALLAGDRDAAFDGILAALEAGAEPDLILDAVVVAASERLLRFDARIDARDDVQEGWLNITHTLTYAHAAREALRRWPDPRALRLLFFAGRFAHHARALDAPRPQPTQPTTAPPEGGAHWGALAPAARRAELVRLALDDTACTRPIFVAHRLKTARVALAEHEHLARRGHPQAQQPLWAAARYLKARIRERTASQAVHEAIRLVLDGKVPRTLT